MNRRPEQDSGVFDTEETNDDQSNIVAKVKASLPRIVFGSLVHPLTHAKTLQQLGHEPYPLLKGRFWFVGSERMFFPNTFSYIRYFARDHGFMALYAGVDSAFLAAVVGLAATHVVKQQLDQKYPKFGGNLAWADNLKESDLNDEKALNRLFRKIIRDSVVQTAGVIAARPFVVVMVRQIGQYIGGEDQYSNVLQSIKTIIRDEGYAGLFRGVMPDIIASETDEEDDKSSHGILSYKNVINNLVRLVASSWFYPYNVAATCMAVQGSGLAAGLPAFGTWQDCLQSLKKTNQAKRGASVLMRVYQGPIKYSVENQAYVADNRSTLTPVLPYSDGI